MDRDLFRERSKLFLVPSSSFFFYFRSLPRRGNVVELNGFRLKFEGAKRDFVLDVIIRMGRNAIWWLNARIKIRRVGSWKKGVVLLNDMEMQRVNFSRIEFR